jgi:phosphatidylinositol-3-phosphatase
MRRSIFTLALLTSTMVGTAFADEGAVPLSGVPRLDHVFVIMMENHGYQEVIGNPYMPFLNAEAKTANLAANYFAVAHPSLTNYLEIVGGSNFAILSDTHPDWHNAACTPAIAGAPNNESSTTNVCPIRGVGMDSPTPLLDFTNETSGPPGIIEIDGVHQYSAARIVAKTIADQLVAKGLTWKTYQESLPLTGADGVGTSDGFFTDTTVFTAEEQAQGEDTGAVLNLYRAEHNPFIYFANVQATAKNGQIPGVVSFEGAYGLWADLATGRVPSYSFIAPNRCNDQHAVGGNAFCVHDPNDNGTQVGLNPGLMAVGDIELQKIVTAIKASPVWKEGRTAIVIVWDESDYAISPITNQVVLVVDKNYGPQGVKSATFYTHFSLLKTIEAAFRLPCLNHACDPSTNLMTDLFAGDGRDFDRD